MGTNRYEDIDRMLLKVSMRAEHIPKQLVRELYKRGCTLKLAQRNFKSYESQLYDKLIREDSKKREILECHQSSPEEQGKAELGKDYYWKVEYPEHVARHVSAEAKERANCSVSSTLQTGRYQIRDIWSKSMDSEAAEPIVNQSFFSRRLVQRINLSCLREKSMQLHNRSVLSKVHNESQSGDQSAVGSTRKGRGDGSDRSRLTIRVSQPLNTDKLQYLRRVYSQVDRLENDRLKGSKGQNTMISGNRSVMRFALLPKLKEVRELSEVNSFLFGMQDRNNDHALKRLINPKLRKKLKEQALKVVRNPEARDKLNQLV